MKEFLAAALDFILCRITIFITGVRPPQELLNIGDGTKIYYANHASHGDFLRIFVSLPYRVRKRVRPVAAAEYWESGPVRRFLAKNVFNMVLISRHKDPLEALAQMSEALKTHSLIIFPEGTRKMNDDIALQPFKSGIFRLAQQCPAQGLYDTHPAALRADRGRGDIVRRRGQGRVFAKGARRAASDERYAK